MLKRFDVSRMTYHPIGEGVQAECVIPVHEDTRIDLEVRCDEEVMIRLVTSEGEFIPLETGRIVRWSGKVSNCSGVEIVAGASFWYSCQRSNKWFEFNDGIPMKVELVHTQADVLKTMIEERLRQYTHAMELNRELTEDEKDELILDIANGDLEFDNRPDEFGLGYEERLQEFIAKQSEPAEPSEEEKASIAAGAAAEPKTSSPT